MLFRSEPDAILITGITPQFTQDQGMTEAEFVAKLHSQVFLPDTIFMGYNTISFDDEFMRFTLFRNFADPYRWQWAENCSRMDIIHLARMTRALRPNGIKWPFASDGKPSNRLEEITKLNNISHVGAHSAWRCAWWSAAAGSRCPSSPGAQGAGRPR